MTTKTLYPYQAEDVKELIARPRVILGSVMRAGKMVETFELVKQIQPDTILIICPKTMISEWRYNVEEWLDASYHDRFDIINYERLRNISIVNDIMKVHYDLIVFDECHHIKNHKAKQTKGAYLIGSSSQRVILMSGTPMQNAPNELYPLLRICDPLRFPSYDKFVDHFCYFEQLPRPPYPMIMKGSKNRTELSQILHEYMIRREKEDLIGHDGERIVKERLPTRTIPVDMDDQQLINYMTMQDELFSLMDTGEKVTAPAVIAQLLRLRQICLDPFLLIANGTFVPHEPSPKTRLLCDILEGEELPSLIYTYFEQYTQCISAELAKRGISHALFTGRTRESDRHQAVLDFQAGKYKALIITLRSGGEGLTLTTARNVIFTDLWWNGAVNDQAASRAEGSGQPEPIQVIELWSKGTIEDYMRRVLLGKQRTFDEVVSNTIKQMREARGG